jgi:hypothetical protein
MKTMMNKDRRAARREERAESDRAWREAQEARQVGMARAAAERAEREQADRQQHADDLLRVQVARGARQLPRNELPGLGVIIRADGVHPWSTSDEVGSRVLGPLAGAQAGIAGAVKTQGAGTAVAAGAAFGAVGALAALGARGSKPFAYVIFPDGSLYQAALPDKYVAGCAQADVLRFNALAAQAGKSS